VQNPRHRPRFGARYAAGALLIATAAMMALPSGQGFLVRSSSHFAELRAILLYNGSKLASSTSVPTEPSDPVQIVWSAQLGRLFLTSSTGVYVTIDPVSRTLVTTKDLGTELAGLAVDGASDRAFVAEPAQNRVAVLNATTGSLLGTTPVGNTPWGVVFDAANGRVYVANSAGTDLTVLSAGTYKVAGWIHVGAQPTWLAVAPSQKRLFAADWGGSGCLTGPAPNSCHLTSIDLSTGTVVANLTLPRVRQMAFDTANGDLYAPEPSQGAVSVVNATSGKLVATVGTGGNGEYPASVAVDPSNRLVYVANEFAANFTVINASTNRMAYATPRTWENNIGSIVYVPSVDRLFGANDLQEGESVLLLPPSTLKVSWTIPLIAEPWGLVYDAVNGRVYVQEGAFSSVYVLSGATGRVLSTTPAGSAGGSPYPAVDSSNGNVFATTAIGPSIIHVATGRITPLPSKMGPVQYVYDPRSNELYYVDTSPSGVSEVNLSTNTVVRSIQYSGWAFGGLAFDPANGVMYASLSQQWNAGSYYAKIVEINGSTGRAIGNISIPSSVANGTGHLVVDAARGRLVVSNYNVQTNAGNLLVISLAKRSLVGIVQLGYGEALDVAMDLGNGYVYASVENGVTGYCSLVKLDMATDRIVGTVGESPQSYAAGLTIDSGTGQIWSTVTLPGIVVVSRA
jgi:DNA-binding beta-propeller fold protein YncE